MMDQQTIIHFLRSTLDPNLQKEASAQLDQMHKIIGFAPSLLQIVSNNQLEIPVRQSGAIYLKNMVLRNWMDASAVVRPGGAMSFHIHEQDRAVIRDAIVDAVVRTPELLRQQLAICIKEMVKSDFPEKWTSIVDKVAIYLQTPDRNVWPGALLSLHKLVKCFEYKEEDVRLPLVEAMNLLLPLMQQRLADLIEDVSEPSVLVQKQILKVFHSYVLHQLPLEQLTRPVFTQWMELVRRVAERPVPEQASQIDEDERAELCWWKCKKWALHILVRTFDRYGRPGIVMSRYEDFAQWYVKTFTGGVIETLVGVLDRYRSHQYVSPRVIQQSFNYLDRCVPHAFTWKLLRPHILVVIKDVLFPLMCFSQSDAVLWEEDPYEFIRIKYDPLEDFVSPVVAGRTLLNSVARKRKDMLREVMMFVVHVLTSPGTKREEKDGILHMVGSISKVLLRKEIYRSQMEAMLTNHVYPDFSSPHGHLRARACWMMQNFCTIKFEKDQSIVDGVNALLQCLLTDTEMPVQVEAAIGLQLILEFQPRAEQILEPNIRSVLVRILDVIRNTDNQELTTVVQRIVTTYSKQLLPIALDLARSLVEAFKGIALCSEEEAEDKMPAAIGLVNVMDLVMDVWEDQTEVTAQLEPVFLQAVVFVLDNHVIELYEDVFKLVASLTATRVSPDMWRVFEMIYRIFEEEGIDYFEEMMPALHNYVTVDVEGLLANEARLGAVYNMCRTVLTGDQDQYKECHAVKLLECVILQCHGRINQYLPSFIQLIVERMMQELGSEDLRILCLQTLIAILYTQPQLLLDTFDKIRSSQHTLVDHFIQLWLNDHKLFTGIHDRKLYVLGWCVLMRMQTRPTAVTAATERILPTCVVVLNGLRKAYEARALEYDSDTDSEGAELASLDEDEDEMSEDADSQLLGRPQHHTLHSQSSVSRSSREALDDDSEYVADFDERYEYYTTPLDAPDCPVDEFVVFRDTLETVQQQQADWYRALTAPLTDKDRGCLQRALTWAEQRRAAAQAQLIKQQGGYTFDQRTVPASFHFGSGSAAFGNP